MNLTQAEQLPGATTMAGAGGRAGENRDAAQLRLGKRSQLAILTAFGKPHYYLMFWILPLITWHMVITRVRNIAEHAVVPDDNDVFRNARTTYASWWERAILAPYWVNYHVDHHLLMYVPCYNLPKLHRLLLAKGYGPRMETQPNYATMLKLAVSKEEVPQAA